MNVTGALVPPGPVTVTPTLPLPAGTRATTCVGSTTEKRVPTDAPPKWTALMSSVKPEPVMTTSVPAGPEAGSSR